MCTISALSAPPAAEADRVAVRLVRWGFPPSVEVVPEARGRLRAVLRDWPVTSDVVDALLLAVSELVANAVTHAALVTEVVRVALGLDGPWVWLEVGDDHPFLPEISDPVDEAAEGGRGLFIVECAVADLAGGLDILPGSPGKAVRVRLPVAA
ncbi:ATP-binding protein [Streptomyces sp. CC208A]|uniref:ATP-binding protein n=1 Tax=Streptomyces sp. CC208A TaxID=3044573 RepID=UPI0024A89B0F|nr:ATP-binding protein [Streptomyces sp. CC208A]